MSRKYRLSKAEMETAILWDEDLDTASIYTHDLRMINKLASLAEKYPESFLLNERSDHRSVTYTIPKRCVGIRPPYSEKRKQAQRQDAIENGLPFLMEENHDVQDSEMG